MNKFKIILPVLFLTLIFVLFSCNSERPTPPDDVQPKENALQPKEGKPSAINLDDVIGYAQQGMIKDCPFNVLDSKLEQVKAKWGNPEKVEKAGYGSYATYKNIVLGFNEKKEIFDLRSNAKELNDLTFENIEEALGEPSDIRELNDEKIYVYVLQENIELKFIIPKNKTGVDHISVFNPQRVMRESQADKDYMLEIKGTSNQLTTGAWEKMQNWRKQIILFSKGQENVYVNGPNKKMVALTFDDGPDGEVTPAIVDILDEYNVPGNFFFLGKEVVKHLDVVKAAYEKGNLILSHTYSHVDLTKLDQNAVRLEIDKTGEAIKSVTGKEPAILRTPYGETNKQVAAIAREEGYSIVLWSIDTLDWSQKETENIVKNVIENVRNGDIILMHSDSEKTETKKALPIMIEALQKRNFEIVDLETLLQIKAYK
ncbi:polysaccharide deacetylase family protein [Cytobacillus depressus]|uniref:Polysaccharide deacetylase family protein n=1 Tax=Cytobacillus depressus TaxID=1602942 RepID=A0A6L3V471_9BACI|nr:polysaccharide deacetylase family protein [Cytobacillus depressus]KAB2334800.1 polysaccharide deacetylase family protein [Cytobacillus depressus]